MPWDWWFVGETATAIALGIGAGGWFVVDRFEMAGLRLLGHPTARKLAGAAEKFSGNSSGGWSGVVGSLVERFLGAKPKQVLVSDTTGEVLGER